MYMRTAATSVAGVRMYMRTAATSVAQVEHLLHERLDALGVDLEQHLRVLLVQVADVRQLHEQLRVHGARRRDRVARLQVLLQQQRVAVLFGRHQLLVADVRPVGREERYDEQQDERRLVGVQVDGERLDELHVVVEQPRAVLGHAQLLRVHGALAFGVARVEEVLFLRIERDHRAQYQQLDAAALEQRDLVGLRQRLERRHFLRHVDDAPHADLGDVDEVGHARGAAVRRCRLLLLFVAHLERRLVGRDQLLDLVAIFRQHHVRLRRHFRRPAVVAQRLGHVAFPRRRLGGGRDDVGRGRTETDRQSHM